MNDIEFEVDAGVAIVTLNRPRVLNALSKAMKLELAKLFCELADDTLVKAVVLVGAGGRAFSSGSDVKEMSDFDSTAAEAMLRAEHDCFQSILSCPKPVVTCVQGYALGAGCQLAMCSDIVLATSDARFGMPELRFGAVNGNETALFMYFGGLGLTRRLVLGCETLDAAEARNWGIVTGLVEDTHELLALGIARARELGNYPGTAYSSQKALLLSWLDQHYSAAVESSLVTASRAWDDLEIRGAMKKALAKESAPEVTHA